MPESSAPLTLPTRSNGKHPGGRPTKRTAALVAELAEAIASGLPDEYACAVVGITRETLHAWRTEPQFSEFSDTIKAVRGQRLIKRLARVEAGDPGWQGTAWILERCYAKEFARPELQLNVEHSGAIDHKIALVSEAELRRMTEIRLEIEAELMA